jgi:general nucleoside transport system ATP-binding protein
MGMTPRLEAATPSAPAGVSALGLSVRNVTKRFGRVVANDDISLDIAAGSIHALVGENGAGKTTLMRIVYGLYPPDSGHVELNGEHVRFRSPRDALSFGVGMVHQHSLLVSSLSVAENVMLALRGVGIPPRRRIVASLRELADASGLHVDPGATVSGLSVGARQRAEILNALFHGARLLILDEPTTVLTPQEVERLFSVLAMLNESGTTIVIVTHKLVEVMAFTKTISVLRGGRLVATVATDKTDEPALIRLMVGRDIPRRARSDGVAASAPAASATLSVRDLRIRGTDGVERVRNASFDVHAGEIVAITGVEGNGQAELVDAIVGTRASDGGEIFLAGAAATRWSVARRRGAGLAYVPESRMTEGVSALVSVRDNLVLGRHNQRPFARFGIRDLRASTRAAHELIQDYNIVAPSTESPAATLSGGNLQKVVVAREIAKSPSILVAAQPTQGVDVAAAHMIRSTLLRLRSDGVAVLLVSSDLSEVSDLADRALVLYNGSVFGELARAELSEEALGYLAMGYRQELAE